MITKNIYIEELVEKYPQTVTFLMRRGIVCIQCGEPVWGTLEEQARNKHIEDIDGLVKDLNDFIKGNNNLA